MNQVTEQGNSENTQLDKIHANYPDTIFNKVNQKKAYEEAAWLFGKEAQQSFHKVSAWYVKILGFLLLAVIVSVLLIRVWHLLAPDCWNWLSESTTNKIDHILLGIFAGISARFFPSTKQPKNE